MVENGQAVRITPLRRLVSPKTGRLYIIRDAWKNPREVAYCECAVKGPDNTVTWHRIPEGANFSEMKPFED